ncbi:hypothetical protein V8G56_06005 [Gaetbulibacter aquiaggeris]|uniref:Uncharacterized protein n=1 Tax=Gaetbulibacter aquiaggeris TaxID=1735373 RepID=A0ABW7MN88_9FLAO
MIKLFRNIRQNLLKDGKTAKYFKYAIGEIVLVVIGILIALQLNQNAENNQQDKTRQDYYIQLLEDLKKDNQLATETIEHFEKDRAEYNKYLETYKNNELEPSQVYQMLMELNIKSSTLSFNSSTIESLRSSGEIILISLNVRNKLINLLRLQDKILKDIQLNDTGKNNMLQDLGIYRGASTLANRLNNQSKLKSYLKFDDNLPQIILGLDAVHIWKDVSEKGTIKHLEIMVEEIEAVSNLIEIEIKNHKQ